MVKKSLLIAGTLSLIALMAIVLTLGAIYTEGYNLPENFVNEESVDHSPGFFMINDIIRYPAKANVTPLDISKNITVGVAAQTSELNFGNVPQNITIRKFISLRNNEKTPVRICVLGRGDIAPHIQLTQGDDFVIQGNRARDMEMTFNSTDIGSYSGEVDIIVRKPRYGLIGYFMDLVRC